jgi:RNA-directed DNA polymerase
LELSKEKTRLTHVDDGFDFLGHNVRKYNGKMLIKPSKRNVKDFLGNIRGIIKSNGTMKTEDLIRILNLKIRGWANYYRHVVSKETFRYVDSCIFKALMRWIKRRHPEKSARWRKQKYFRSQGMRQWIFSASVPGKDGKTTFLDLFMTSYLPIRRHVKIRAEANPHDPAYDQYFQERERLKNISRMKDRGLLYSKRIETLGNHRTTGSCKHGF